MVFFIDHHGRRLIVRQHQGPVPVVILRMVRTDQVFLNQDLPHQSRLAAEIYKLVGLIVIAKVADGFPNAQGTLPVLPIGKGLCLKITGQADAGG